MAATNLSTQERSTDVWINDWEEVKLSDDDLEEVKFPVVASPLFSTIEISDDNTNLLKATNISTQERSTDVWIKRDHTCVDDWEEAPFPGVSSPFSTIEISDDYTNLLKPNYFQGLMTTGILTSPSCRLTFGGYNGHLVSLNQHCNTYMQSYGIVKGDFGLTVFEPASFESVKAFFFSRKLGYETLFYMPKEHLVRTGGQLNTLLSKMGDHGVPAEATFYELHSGDSFYVPPRFQF